MRLLKWLRKTLRRASWVFYEQELTEKQRLAVKKAEEHARLSRLRRELIGTINVARARGVDLPPPEEWVGWG